MILGLIELLVINSHLQVVFYLLPLVADKNIIPHFKNKGPALSLLLVTILGGRAS